MEKIVPKLPKIEIETLLAEGHDAFQISSRAKVLEILKSQGEILPAADSPLGRLWQLVNSEESEIDDCVKVIALDPALTSRVFRLANSVAYGGRATTISEAVLFLGFAQIRQVAFSKGIFDQFSKLKLPPGWSHFWVRNVFIARMLERLSAHYFRTNGSEYLAGLLHDTGWLLLANFFPREFELIFSGSMPPDEAEKKIFGFTHADIAAAICARSLLPLRVINAVISHHDPVLISAENLHAPGESARFLSIIINVCDRLADVCQIQEGEERAARLIQLGESEEIGWLNQFGTPIHLNTLIEEEMAKAQELASIFLAGTHA